MQPTLRRVSPRALPKTPTSYNPKEKAMSKDEVKVGQIWASNDKRRGHLAVEVVAVKGRYATVKSVDTSLGGSAAAQRKVKLSRFSKHNGYKLIDRATVNLVNAVNAPDKTTVAPPAMEQVRQQTGAVRAFTCHDTAAVPPEGPGTVDVHEEVTAEHPILR